ncbi:MULTISPECIES: helix-turn-helix domain-containing protein [Pectobacterium]|uniref:helix-turn-helix domain-containing protein n=1 Tax=Pectobacterium TaxID=122277 RepID=UPI001D00988D|nr:MULTISPECIES: helix-turn-helix transcriptional regulator [Pectobacterium]UKE85620.1 helix-turn-helix transcriptional regulator [Pectobacterium sp. PL152]WED70112.1 helix-turn-helix transcriptional regulator [Pectobacterium colocasium]
MSDVLRETDLSRNTVTLMYKEMAQKIDIEALDKLCRLFECEVADTLEFTDEQG